jgi:colanic acid/amylovoran biosynthesis glycosyltransferase
MGESEKTGGKIAFFFPVYGFEHQRYLEKRIQLLQDKPYHIVCLIRAPGSGWGFPEENISILCHTKTLARILNKLKKITLGIFFKLRNLNNHCLIAPIGWKRQLRHVVKAHKIKAFIIFYGASAILVGDELGRLGLPFSIFFEGSDSQMGESNLWYRNSLKKVWQQACSCIFVSEFLKKQALERNCPAPKSIVSLNGTTFPLEKPPYVLEYPLRLISVGNLFPVKGHKYLLEGFRVAVESGLDLSLTIVGGGWLETDLKEMAKTLGIGDKVWFTGAVPWEEVIVMLMKSHLFLLTSVRADDGQEEGLGLAAIEAQALGKPAIVSDSGGLPEVVKNGVTGIVVPERDSCSIGQAIIKLYHDPIGLYEMSKKAYERAYALFNIDRQGEELRKVRDNLLSITHNK